jgi:dolichol-phosphate mannosyltransferase
MNRPPLRETLISVVLPVFNEANVLEELHTRVSEAVAQCGTRHEIVFVNDGSTDSSPQILDLLAERHANVRVIHFSRNFGHQAAVQAGLAHARGHAIILMDSDLQDAPEALGRLIAEWVCGYDVIYALRRERPEAWWKRCLFATFHRLLARVASTPMPTDAGNFSLIDGRVAKEIVALGERDRYLPGLRSWVGFKQRGIEVRRNPRYDGKPRVSFRGLWRLAKTAIFSFSSFPLTTFYLIGYTALGVFVALGSYSLFCKLVTAVAIPGWTSNVLVASFFGAVNALGISILGEYVIRIYDQVRGRPLYLVERTCNVDQSESAETASFELTVPVAGAIDPDDDYEELLEEAESLLAATTPIAKPAVALAIAQPSEESAAEGSATERRKTGSRNRPANSRTPKVAGSRRKSTRSERKERRGQ